MQIVPKQALQSARANGLVNYKTHAHILPPRPLLAETRTGLDYPLEQLPPRLQSAAHAIAGYVQAPLALAAQCVIGAAVHLLQTRINAPSLLNPAGMPASIFQISLCGSGDRKSACRNLAFHVIDEREREENNTYLKIVNSISLQAQRLRGKDRESFIRDNPPPPDPCTQYSDATFESIVGEFIRGKSAITWDTDEGGQLLCGPSLKSDTSIAIVGGLCKAFDRGIFERRRVRGNAEGSGVVYHRRLSIHLLSQPATVAAALNDPLLTAQGFLPRFLFAAPNSIAGTRFLSEDMLYRSPEDIPEIRRFWDHCKAVIETPQHIHAETGEVLPPVLELTTPAQGVWLDFYNQIEEELGVGGRYANLRPYASRAGELVRRLAAVFAGFEGRALIDDDMMSRACHITRHSLEEWLHYSEASYSDPMLVDAQALLDWLKAKSWTEFHRDKLGKAGPAAVRTAKRRDQLLSILVEHGYLMSTDGKTFQLTPLAETADSAETQQ